MSSKHSKTVDTDAIQPLQDWVLLKRDLKDKTDGGVLIPEMARASLRRLGDSTVLAVGPGLVGPDGACIQSRLRPGDRVVVDPRGAFFATPEDEAIGLLRESDILASIKREHIS